MVARDDSGNPRLRRRVLTALGTEPLIDVRSPRNTGEHTHARLSGGALRGGHIPTAVSIPWAKGCRADGQFHSRAELDGSTPDSDPAEPTIAYCRIGERSNHTWFVLTHLSVSKVRNYDGSWTEWGNRVRVPIVVGDEPGGLRDWPARTAGRDRRRFRRPRRVRPGDAAARVRRRLPPSCPTTWHPRRWNRSPMPVADLPVRRRVGPHLGAPALQRPREAPTTRGSPDPAPGPRRSARRRDRLGARRLRLRAGPPASVVSPLRLRGLAGMLARIKAAIARAQPRAMDFLQISTSPLRPGGLVEWTPVLHGSAQLSADPRRRRTTTNSICATHWTTRRSPVTPAVAKRGWGSRSDSTSRCPSPRSALHWPPGSTDTRCCAARPRIEPARTDGIGGGLRRVTARRVSVSVTMTRVGWYHDEHCSSSNWPAGSTAAPPVWWPAYRFATVGREGLVRCSSPATISLLDGYSLVMSVPRLRAHYPDSRGGRVGRRGPDVPLPELSPAHRRRLHRLQRYRTGGGRSCRRRPPGGARLGGVPRRRDAAVPTTARRGPTA